MSESLHSMTFANEISDWVLVFLINFEELDSHCAFPPGCFVNDAIAAFRDLFAERDLFEGNLHAGLKSARIESFWELEFAFLFCLHFDILLIFIAE